MLEQSIRIITEAGYLVKNIRKNNNVIIETKADNSLVTNADKASEALILKLITEEFGQNQIILSEESILEKNYCPSIKEGAPFWLVDPIDATYSYANGLNDYCINITYLENHQPILGLIYAPELNTLWYAIKNMGAFKKVDNKPAQAISVRDIPNFDVTVVTSKIGHQLTKELKEKYSISKELVVASAIKFCYIAEGKADYYFKQRNKACDWDIASGSIIVKEAGGEIILLDEPHYKYGIPPFLAPSLIAKGKTINNKYGSYC